jgi:hypothetical protein
MADRIHQPRTVPSVTRRETAGNKLRAHDDGQPHHDSRTTDQAAKHADRYAAEDGMGRQDDPAAAMEHPSGDGNYVREGDREMPLASHQGEED